MVDFFLKEGVDPNIKTPEFIIRPENQEFQTNQEPPLHKAVRCWINRDEIFHLVDSLLAYGADPNLGNKEEETSLHILLKFD